MDVIATDLAVARGGVPVLAGVTFALAPGRALVLRGANGSGKTTLLRTLAGLQPPLLGEVTGLDERVAYAGHSDGLKAMLSVRENLAFWADVFGGGSMDAALCAFELDGLVDRLAGTLSAGQKRRLGLARLMVTGRDVWILDEPTVSLDAGSVALFAAAVQGHLATGGQAILATHIELGLPQSATLDVTPFRAKPGSAGDDEAFF